MKLTLTLQEQLAAKTAGAQRYADRLESPHRWNRADDHTEEKEVEALGAEMAVARLMGVPWEQKDRPDPEGDVGEGVQVRHTRYTSGRLLLHDSDRDDHVFYLVTGRFPTYNVVGWISGRRGKLEGAKVELQPGRPCVAVEQHQLEEAA